MSEADERLIKLETRVEIAIKDIDAVKKDLHDECASLKSDLRRMVCVEDFKKEVDKLATKDQLEASKSLILEKIIPLQRIVYAACALIFTAFWVAVIGLVIVKR